MGDGSEDEVIAAWRDRVLLSVDWASAKFVYDAAVKQYRVVKKPSIDDTMAKCESLLMTHELVMDRFR